MQQKGRKQKVPNVKESSKKERWEFLKTVAVAGATIDADSVAAPLIRNA